MTSSQRRPGFRLPWSGDSEADEGHAHDAPPASSADAGMIADAPAAEAAPATTTTRDADAPAIEPVAEATERPSEPPNEFLKSLVSAMRGVAEEARESSVHELQSTIDTRVEEMRTRSGEEAEDLRRRAEVDTEAIAEWSRTEMERIRQETDRKTETRRKQLDRQLSEHQQRTERAIESMQSRVEEYERQLGAFFEQLAQIEDPAEFVAAAKRMPSSPVAEIGAEPSATGPTAASLDARLAQLSGPETKAATGAKSGKNGNGGASRRATDKAAEQPDGTPADGSEATTSVVVKGLGSFGAITTFKQALEQVDGVGSVALSLGPTGEFVYRATHQPAFDLVAAITGVEPSASVDAQADGTLRVTVSRSR
ncbi:MAG: apolipoprotein A1/A4/E family protein [Chloroflexota bacterium]|nr:apolipoprotein A1/A4/E family protein [Chloroflexota bacterium]